jgi:hypothetical protein
MKHLHNVQTAPEKDPLSKSDKEQVQRESKDVEAYVEGCDLGWC